MAFYQYLPVGVKAEHSITTAGPTPIGSALLSNLAM